MQKTIQYFHSFAEAPDPKSIDVLDGIRALCILLVGWFHIWQQSWLSPTLMIGRTPESLDFLLRSGYIWVDGLLLLSGFLLYLPYAQGGSLPSAFAFYKRRLIRVLPSYLLCIIPLFILALIQHRYRTPGDAALDLLAHLTFTHTLFPMTYYQTPLNGALWTLAVEMQFYLLFPLLARAFRKFPALTFTAMAGIALAFRMFAASRPDSSMYFNQLPAFLDVYAIGFAGASAFALIRKKLGNGCWDKRIKLFFSVLFILCLCQLVMIARGQASSNGVEGIRRGQMGRRFQLAATLCCAMLCASFSLPGIRFLLGNPVMRFFSAISFQFYIYHQMLAVKLKQWGFPPSASPNPWQTDPRWQLNYTLCCFALAIAAAALITFLFERPLARQLRRKTKAV